MHSARTRRGALFFGLQWLFYGLIALFASASLARITHPFDIPIIDFGVFNLSYLVAAAICFLRATFSEQDRKAWQLIGLAICCNTAGNITFSYLLETRENLPQPSLADVFFLMWFPLIYTALILVLRSRIVRFLPSMWLDAVVATLGAAAVITALIAAPLIARLNGNTSKTVINLVYPAADAILLVVVIGGAAALGSQFSRSFVWCLAGITLTGVADLAFLLGSFTYSGGTWVDLIWLLGITCIATAARNVPIKSTAKQSVNDAPQPRLFIGWGVLAIPAIAMISAILLLGFATQLTIMARIFAVGCLALGLVRVGWSFLNIRDLTDVHRQARTDELTGLANRRALYEKCSKVLADPTAHPCALLIVDIDRFKLINDALGPVAGDELLYEVGQRLTRACSKQTVLSRIGGDEFSMLLPRTTEQGAAAIAQTLQAALAPPIPLNDVSVHIQGSYGIAIADPELAPQKSRSELLRRANIAMHQAKPGIASATDRQPIVCYSSVSSQQAVDQLLTVEDLHSVIMQRQPHKGQLIVHLQPQLDLKSGLIRGVESLVRWQHPSRGIIPPGLFLPAAQAASMMGQLTEIVLAQSLSACRTWWMHGLEIPISVNISAANVQDHQLPEKVMLALTRQELPTSALVLEVTEDSLMVDPESAQQRLKSLRSLGLQISIDDYGSGYSSLSYLRDLSVDELKIDRTFVSAIDKTGAGATIVKHTIELAHALNLRTVAEGVEEQETIEVLTELGCDLAQGYHIARPMSLDAFGPWLAEHQALNRELSQP